jgi:acetyl esterase
MAKTSPAAKGMPQRLRSGVPDGQARAFLRYFNLLSTRHIGEYSMSELRRIWRLMALALGRREPVAAVTNHEIPGPAGPILLRVFHPEGAKAPRPGFLWCHGGGFLVGSADSADSMCRQIARASGIAVASAHYRLAPEHDLYAGREDVLATLEWIAEHGARIGIDATRLAIGGDSAGGNIAAAVAQETVRRGHPPLKLQVLAYPATCIGRDYPSKAENATGYFLTAQNMDWMTRVIAASVDLEDQWLSPGCAKDLRGMPPALIVTAGFDPLRDDGLDYAAKLRTAGVPVELLHYAGQFHGFLNFDSILSAGRDGLERIGAALAAALHEAASPDRTIEIAAAAATPGAGLRNVAREVTTAAMMAWESAEQWVDTGLEVAAPPLARLYRPLLGPWLLPGAWLRESLGSRLERLEARQTHPVRASAG